ncbi:Ribosomal protein S14, mitochondrial [Zostera marina]|uniref:Small ribosomal subunit protein uS14m n=1 Tax=Zostera marina TaxID=29655 RepID=A0A0K9PMQ2_ZOSMR|nr:Ribosomal protein S14, mitochondrial [Zostera marina]
MDTRNIQDHKRRLLYAKYEVKRRLFKALVRDPDLPSDLHDKFRNKLSALPRNSSLTRVRNRCIFSGRARGVLSLFRMSRIVFRTLANRGEISGIKKSSW